MNESQDKRRGGEAADSGRNGPPAILIAGLVVSVLTLIFVFSNSEDTLVKFLGWEWTIKTWLLIVISAILGAILARVFGWWWRRRRSRS